MLTASVARAQNTHAYEHFNYATGQINGQNDGGGWAGPWTADDSVVSPGATIACNGLQPSGNALGPTVGNASVRMLATPIVGAPGTSMNLSAVITSNVDGTAGTQATLGNSAGGTFIIGDLPESDPQAANWGLQTSSGLYYTAKPVVANAQTCLVAQIDFGVKGGRLDRMRLWVDPPLHYWLVSPDIDISTSHVPVFSGVFWQTQQGQAVDEISIYSAVGCAQCLP
jgi:hypothetical protein